MDADNQAAAKYVKEKFGKIDVIIACAGEFDRPYVLHEGFVNSTQVLVPVGPPFPQLVSFNFDPILRPTLLGQWSYSRPSNRSYRPLQLAEVPNSSLFRPFWVRLAKRQNTHTMPTVSVKLEPILWRRS
jgi:hypothetical protein